MSNNAPLAQLTYHVSVMIWGNQSPWKQLAPRLNHATRFRPEDVVTDGKGNILSMPTLERKPCFARPEAVFRHGKRKKKIPIRGGKIVYSTNHQCGSCPADVHEACVRIAYERVRSDQSMSQSFCAWWDHCKQHCNGMPTCTGSASQLWGDFKRAIANRGPFANSNDAAVLDLQQQKQNAQREQWKQQKRRQRQFARERAQQAQQLPSEQFVCNVIEERDCRANALLAVLGQSGQPPSRAKVPSDKRESTATITANAWALRTILTASGRNAQPGTVARLMTEHNLGAGVPGPTLKERIKRDLKRADECEKDGLWKRFDPDADLESYQTIDDDTADELSDPMQEIDFVLQELVKMPAVFGSL